MWKYKTPAKKGSDRRNAANRRHIAITDTYFGRSNKEKIGPL